MQRLAELAEAKYLQMFANSRNDVAGLCNYVRQCVRVTLLPCIYRAHVMPYSGVPTGMRSASSPRGPTGILCEHPIDRGQTRVRALFEQQAVDVFGGQVAHVAAFEEFKYA